MTNTTANKGVTTTQPATASSHGGKTPPTPINTINNMKTPPASSTVGTNQTKTAATTTNKNFTLPPNGPTTPTTTTSTTNNNNNRNLAIARHNLVAALEKGMEVIKHGRSGAPKKRLLRCDTTGTLLYWHADGDNSKSVNINEVTSIRKGSEPDPLSPTTKQKYGTTVLRRHCKAEELAISFSLILPDRSVSYHHLFSFLCQY